jgi:tight adherence protein B
VIVVVVVFIAAFVVFALLLSTLGATASQEKKQVSGRLDSLIAKTKESVEDDLVSIRKQETLSTIPLLNRFLASLEIAPRLRDLLAQANLSWTPGRLVLMSVACWVLPAWLVYLKTDGAVIGLLFGMACAWAPLGYVLMKRRKRFDAFEQGLPATLDLIVSALRSGHSLISAIGLASKESPDPIGREFRICFDEQNYGLELRTAMQNLATRVPIQDVQIMITAIVVQKETGGNLAEVLDRCAHIIRERFRLKKEIRTKTAQGRLTGWVLSAMPISLAFLLYLMNPEVMSLLWTRALGQKMMYAGLAMMVIGGLIIRKIVQIRV